MGTFAAIQACLGTLKMQRLLQRVVTHLLGGSLLLRAVTYSTEFVPTDGT